MRYEIVINLADNETKVVDPISRSADGSAKASKGEINAGVISVKAAAIAFGKTAFDYTVHTVTRNTGYAPTEARVNAVKSLLTQGAMIGGLALINPAAALITAGTVAMSYARQADEVNYAKRWENQQISRMVERGGASFNRSRSK